MQDVDAQIQCNANNITKPGFDANSIVMGENNNSNMSFLSEQTKEDDMKINVKQASQRNNNNVNKSFPSG